MKVTCDLCGVSSSIEQMLLPEPPARFKCRGCGKEWGLVLSTGPKKIKTVVHHDPRQQQLIDLAREGDECAESDLFKEVVCR